MKVRDEDLKKEAAQKKAPDQMLDWAGRWYQRFDDFVHINKDDSVGLLFIKFLMRLVGLVIMLALSPFFILGLILAFIVVM